MNRPACLAPLLLVVFLLTGCASAPEYACGVPGGVTCKPVSEVHADTISGPSAPGRGGEPLSTAVQPLTALQPRRAASAVDAANPATLEPGDPILSTPRVLRLWIAPFEDEARDLHDETYLYLRLDEGSWQTP